MNENLIKFPHDSDEIEYFVIKDEYNEEIKEFMIKNGVTALLISPYHGFKLSNVSFLSELDFVETINFIFTDNIQNINALENLKNLKRLYLDTPIKGKLDFSNFPELEDCGIEWNKNIINIHNLRKIKKLRLFKYTENNIEKISELITLEELLFSEGSLSTIDGIQRLKNLRSLSLYYLKNLNSILQLSHNCTLEHIDITCCKNLVDYTYILWTVSNLKRLGLSKMPPINTINGIQQLKKLEHLVINESTKILDGETKYLLELPRLRYLALQTYRHYSITEWDIEKQLGIKQY